MVAHTYTPGLRVTESALIHRERRLPLRGEVLAAVGDAVDARTVVARARLPGNVQTVNLASLLAVDPARVPGTLEHPVGTLVRKGQPLATGRSLFGLVRHTVNAPADGTIESVSHITGQLILREPPLPVEVCAYVQGVVTAVLPGEGVVVEARGALVQGIFGVGGEAWGELTVAVEGPGDELTPYRLRPEHRGMVVVGGCHASFDALARARDLGVTAVVVGGFDDGDLRQLLGRDLGVAITGSEEVGITLVLTEGFGRIRMAERTWRLLAEQQGRLASVSGATQIRAGVVRPEIIVPRAGGLELVHEEAVAGLGVGSLVRVIREPWFGRIGRVVELPSELHRLDTEALVRVLMIRFVEDDTVAVVPRANVEIISP